MSITRIGTYAQIKGSSQKIPCHVATASDILLSGLQVIDGISLAGGERVLVRAQLVGGDNGIYIADAGTWVRAVDMSLDDDVYEGITLWVNNGITFANLIFYIDTPNPIFLGTTAIAFTAIVPSGTSGSSGTSGTSGIDGPGGPIEIGRAHV